MTTAASVLRTRLLDALCDLPIFHERPEGSQVARSNWVVLLPLECTLEPDTFSRNSRGWKTRWDVPLLCSSGPGHRQPADAQEAAWQLVEEVFDTLVASDVLHSSPVLRVAPAAVQVEQEWSDNGELILSVLVTIETRGWKEDA